MMKKIGMLGGMSWESTAQYYELINRELNRRLGCLHSARIVLNSVDFHDIELLQKAAEWGELADILSEDALNLELAGADFIVICTNTMHKVEPDIAAAVTIPVLHIADATGQVLKTDNIRRVGLLGTAFTMEQDFYKSHLATKFGIDVVIPNAEDRSLIHNVIYDELCKGVINDKSRQGYLKVIDRLHAEGCEGVILGCTEIPLLVNQSHTDIALYDTTKIHALAAVALALAKE